MNPPPEFRRIFAKLRTMPKWFGVIEGGSNRPEVDLYLYAVADLVLLPFRDSHEDMRTVRHDLDAFPDAYGIPSQWPTNPWQQMAADRTLNELMQCYPPRLLNPILYSERQQTAIGKRDTRQPAFSTEQCEPSVGSASSGVTGSVAGWF